MKGEYERLVLSLEPWLRQELIKQEVPGYLKPLGDEAGAEGVAADVRAKVMEKALSVAHKIESGRLRTPAKPKSYFKQVMRSAIADWFRSQPKAAPLTPDKVAMIDDVVHDEDEGAEGTQGWHGERGAVATVQQGSRRRPRILAFLQFLQRLPADYEVANRLWREGDWERVQPLLDAIPKENRRQAVLLRLQNYPEREIAAQLLKTQQAVSKGLQAQWAIWGWDEEQIQRVQHGLLYFNLTRAVRQGRKRVRRTYCETVPRHNLIAEEQAVYQAVMSDPALTHWTDGLERRHMRRVIDLLDLDDDLYDESDCLDPDSPEWPQLP